MIELGAAIARRRKSLKLSQEELADKLGVARQTISSWEHDIFLPDSKYLIVMSNIFDCSLDELINSGAPPSAVLAPLVGAGVIESLLRAWKEMSDAVKTVDPAILAGGVNENERATIISEGREAVASLETALNRLEAI